MLSGDRGVDGVEGRHELTLSARRELTVTGVTHVDHYHGREVVVATGMGFLVVTGEELSIDHLSLEEGLLKLKGLITGLAYTEQEKSTARSQSVWRKLWR
ncbi:MAG: sporulation protein YabP [Clostridia bacterium]|jgi:sporulation protein YabP|nr:sporulation protein YabP [Clostridia bacterium]MDH7572709.1 sporulation protein YabP [Clostridia bacterium]